jgi:hypothetical protein
MLHELMRRSADRDAEIREIRDLVKGIINVR